MRDVTYLLQQGIDVEHGISLLGDFETYISILKEFKNNFEEKMQKLATYKETSDFKNYGIEAHSLKSDSKYLGFSKLAELAYTQEIAGKANDYESINRNYNDMVIEARRIMEIVNNYLESGDIKEEKEDNIKSEQSILVADDSKIITSFLEEVFTNKYKVLQAHDGNEVIKLIEDSKNNIIALLLDLNMPNVDGFEVLDYFQEHNLFKKIPVSIISGSGDKNTIEKAFTYPIVDMLTKPFEKGKIENVVEKTIQLSSIEEN